MVYIDTPIVFGYAKVIAKLSSCLIVDTSMLVLKNGKGPAHKVYGNYLEIRGYTPEILEKV